MGKKDDLKFKINDEIISTDIEDICYLLNLNTGKYIKLNNSSKFIYKHLKNNLGINEILNLITAKFSVDEINARKDIHLFIDKALKLNIISQKDD